MIANTVLIHFKTAQNWSILIRMNFWQFRMNDVIKLTLNSLFRNKNSGISTKRNLELSQFWWNCSFFLFLNSLNIYSVLFLNFGLFFSLNGLFLNDYPFKSSFRTLKSPFIFKYQLFYFNSNTRNNSKFM